mgnify:CR=1 FL=1
MEKIINKLDKIYLVILCLNIALLNLLVGSTHTDPRFVLQALIMFETLIYIIIQKINKKQNIIIKNKIDVVMLLFTISSILPFIFKTYVSKYYTINMFLMTITMYCLYIQTRNIITTPKRKNVIIITSLISSILIIIFGIDKLYFNTFKPFLDKIYTAASNAYGMTSTLGYSNAVASYMMFMFILALGKYLQTPKKSIKCLYALSMQISMLGFYFGNSRAGMILLSIILFFYCIMLKKKILSIRTIFQLIFTFSYAILFEKVTQQYTTETILWVQLSGFLVINYLINYILEIFIKKINMKRIEKYISIKKLITLILIITIGIGTFIIIDSRSSEPITKKDDEIVTIYGNIFDSNTKYEIKIDYEANIQEDSFIQINVRNQYRKNNTIGKMNVKNGKNTDIVEVITPDMIIERGQLVFKTKGDGNITINKIYINDKEYVAKCKYVPESILKLMRTVNFKTTSVSERISMYKSGLKLVKRSPLIGSGGKTYSSLFATVKEYNYSTFELHNYIIDLLIDYGIFGLLMYVIIIALTIKSFLKSEKNITDLSIFTAIMFVTIHTIFDFDLAYMVTFANYFIFIAIININDKEIQAIKLEKWICSILCVIFAILIIFNIRCVYGKYLLTKKEYEKAIKYYPYSKEIKERIININENNKEMLKNYFKTEKNNNQLKMCRKLYKKISSKYSVNKYYDGKEEIKIIYNELIINPRDERYNVSAILNKGELLNSMVKLLKDVRLVTKDEELEEMIYGFANEFLEKYDENVEQIKDTNKNLYKEENIARELDRYKKIYDDLSIYKQIYMDIQ